MGYDYYFINDTKKQIVGSKVLYMDYEAGNQLLAYLSLCVGDTIRIVGEEYTLAVSAIVAYPLKNKLGYKFINLYEYNIKRDSDGYMSPEEELNKLYEEVNK